ncbi:transposase IS116/IS110/IS902 family protein [Desulfofarcimen acetoxidans DSM 771]|uniref:Transposase IS116/IS110/IS902 family protein n=1 Tax=Desulfofarcimen acetoxidans (strain ATCC 49208 / DSM 771 / KCTC 5769 / VKM B-1644 / 5575) TaxID=485916 RepID=C8W2U0_DESAS|nr:IS110 family transposase [Desulfofarcimen acetoxidans]ACV61096.1 transposase IS116/IS110/IS902 family protein [Desulfofarcimen acetoxidans DSM 771]
MPESKTQKPKKQKAKKLVEPIEIDNDALYENCAGLDVHQETVVICVLFGSIDKRPKKVVETFKTTTSGLLDLADFLLSYNVTHVAMESTSVYWKPVWNVLENTFSLILANARTIKNVPGRKTDVKDASWIAKLLRNGLIEGSFVPPLPIRDLRDLTRYKRKLLNDLVAEKNRIHKTLQDANIKLTTYISDIFGVSRRNLLEAIICGQVIKPADLDVLIKGKLRKKIPEIVDALNGRLRLHHREMLLYSWDHILYIEKVIANIEVKIQQELVIYQEAIELIKSLSLIKDTTAAVIIVEIGVDMTVFHSDKHISSWAGLSPGNNESAGKRKSSRTTQGNTALKSILCQCAWAASRQRDSRLNALFWRITKNQGKKKAVIATAHEILVIVYHMLSRGVPYNELGRDYLGKHINNQESKAVKYLTQKGYIIQPPEGECA